MYADDTQLYLPFSLDKAGAAECAVRQMEDCIEDIRKWMSANKLKLNDDKSELIIFTPSRQVHKCNIKDIKMGDCTVEASASVRDLGVVFDRHMNMKAQVDSIVRQTNFQLRSIGKVRQYLSFEACSSLIHASISSRLDYGNSLLYGIPDDQIKRLQKVQNTAARILTRTGKYDHITPVLKSLHWLPVKKRIQYKILLLTFKCIHNLAPEYLCELIKVYGPSCTLRSANKGLTLISPSTKMVYCGDKAFAKCAPELWNDLPANIRGSSTVTAFKAAIKNHLFNQSY